MRFFLLLTIFLQLLFLRMAQNRDKKKTLHEGEDEILPDLKLMYKAFMSEFKKLSTRMDGMEERINEASRIQNHNRSIDSYRNREEEMGRRYNKY